MALTKKRRIFLEAYLQCWNATEAARRAGYAHPMQQGHRLLSNVEIEAEIKNRLDREAMTADEVLRRLAQLARFDLGPYIIHGKTGWDIDVERLIEDGYGGLIRSVVILRKDMGTKVELHDAQTALLNLGKHHKLFTDKFEIGGDKDNPLLFQDVSGIDFDKL